MESAAFWSTSQPGFRFSAAPVGSPEFFADVERHRYTLEPHIPDVVRFDEHRDRDVLEVGCGIATDGARFVRAGARYVGLDQSEAAVELARRRFSLERLAGRFEVGPATSLPFPDDSFDLVYSHGVIHHIPDTAGAVRELHRVLRPGGTVLAMVYHRDSLNYRFSILVVRRTLAALLVVPGAERVLERLAPADVSLVHGHRELLRAHGLRYLLDTRLFLSNNTDGPGNPLSKVFSRREASELFAAFEAVETTTRYLNLRLYPMGGRLAGTRAARRLERRFGWHLYVRGRKPSGGAA